MAGVHETGLAKKIENWIEQVFALARNIELIESGNEGRAIEPMRVNQNAAICIAIALTKVIMPPEQQFQKFLEIRFGIPSPDENGYELFAEALKTTIAELAKVFVSEFEGGIKRGLTPEISGRDAALSLGKYIGPQYLATLSQIEGFTSDKALQFFN